MGGHGSWLQPIPFVVPLGKDGRVLRDMALARVGGGGRKYQRERVALDLSTAVHCRPRRGRAQSTAGPGHRDLSPARGGGLISYSTFVTLPSAISVHGPPPTDTSA